MSEGSTSQSGRGVVRPYGQDSALSDLQRRIWIWHQQSFPGADKWRILDRLCDELDELESAMAYATSEEGENEWHAAQEDIDLLATELADCAILLMQLASYHDIDLAEAIAEKHVINLRRAWNPEMGQHIAIPNGAVHDDD